MRHLMAAFCALLMIAGMAAPPSLALAQTGAAPLVTITPTVQNAAYSSGNCVGGFNPIVFSPAASQGGIITNVRVSSVSGQTTGYTVYLFSGNPSSSTCTDKGTFTLATADVSKLIAAPFVLTPAAPTGTTVSFAEVSNLIRPTGAGAGAGNRTIYEALVANGSVTPGSTTDIQITVGGSF